MTYIINTTKYIKICNLFAEYPAFQDFLLINQFPKVAVDIIKTDDESYVRASALIFIATMIRINKLWERQLSQVNLAVRIPTFLFAF